MLGTTHDAQAGAAKALVHSSSLPWYKVGATEAMTWHMAADQAWPRKRDTANDPTEQEQKLPESALIAESCDMVAGHTVTPLLVLHPAERERGTGQPPKRSQRNINGVQHSDSLTRSLSDS